MEATNVFNGCCKYKDKTMCKFHGDPTLTDCYNCVYLDMKHAVSAIEFAKNAAKPITGAQYNDIISRPAHYIENRKYEPKDVIRDWGLNFNLGSAVKYIARAGRKDDAIQDLNKAKTFLEFEIEALKEENDERE